MRDIRLCNHLFAIGDIVCRFAGGKGGKPYKVSDIYAYQGKMLDYLMGKQQEADDSKIIQVDRTEFLQCLRERELERMSSTK